MPIENERKFVLEDDGALEARLATKPGVTRNYLRQAYLDASGLRIRSIGAGGRTRHVFTYKRPVDDQMVEIETEIAPVDFERLWKLRRETLQKARYSWNDGHFHWDVDFFKTDDGRTYFALAEVEMPEERHRAAATAGRAGAARAAAGAAERSALHLQAAGRSRPCRAAAGRRAREGRGGMKIAAHRDDLAQGSFHVRRRTGRLSARLDDATTSCW